MDEFSPWCDVAPYDRADGGSVDIFMNGIILPLWGAGAILQDGYGI